VRYDVNSYETIGTLIARVRGEQGISQLRLAERMCASAGLPTLTRHEISRWEREARIPSAFWLPWLAVALGLPREQVERAIAVTRHRRAIALPPNWMQDAPGVYVRVA
jgi:transcriptional regulator with XRE-family HTH domain